MMKRIKKRYIVIFFLLCPFLWYGLNIKVTEPLPKGPDVLFIGDSITYGWNYFPQVLPAYLKGSVAVEGLGGIDTLDLYAILSSTKSFKSRLSIPWWRSRAEIEETPFGRMHFALKGYSPRVVVLEIGVNNWLRTILGENRSQIEAYKASRSYKELDLEDIQEDAAVGSVNNRGVYQLIYQLKELYGDDTPIILVGAFPTYFLPKAEAFNSFLKEFTQKKDDPILTNISYLDPAPVAQIGWSDDYEMFYDHEGFPAEKQQFDSIHVDWGHLNEKGYHLYARMLECPVEKALEGFKNNCSPIGAADMNATLGE